MILKEKIALDKEKIINTHFEAVDQINDVQDEPDFLDKYEDTVLFGYQGKLNSRLV